MRDLESWAGRLIDEPAWHAYRRQLQAEGKSGDTIYNYRHALQLLSLWLGEADRDLWSATAGDVTGWLAAGAPSWAPASLAAYSRRLRTFCRWAVASGYAAADPMAALAPVRETVREIPIPDRGDVRRLADAVSRDTSFRGRRDWVILCLLAEAGTPRAAELAALTTAAADLRRDALTFLGKGRLERTIPLGAASCRAITLYLRARARHKDAALPWLLLGRRGPMTRHGVRQALEDRCDALGIARIPPHHWRHLTADAAASAKLSDAEMMKLYGWRTPLMAHRYGAAAAGRRAVSHARELSLGDRLLTGREEARAR